MLSRLNSQVTNKLAPGLMTWMKTLAKILLP